jgi:hypothetical protein
VVLPSNEHLTSHLGVWGTKSLWGVDSHHYLTKSVSWRARCVSVKCLARTYPVGLTVPPWGLLTSNRIFHIRFRQGPIREAR